MLFPLAQRWQALPRAAQWGVAGVLAIGAYFGIIERSLDLMKTWRNRADAKQSELVSFAREREARRGADQTTEQGLGRFGNVEPPGSPASRSEAFNKQLTKLLREREIRQPAITSRDQPMVGGPLNSKLAADERLIKLVTDIKFDASPEQCVRVLADLEQSGEVANVSRVQFTVPSGEKGPPMLRAWITAEAWQVVKKARGK